MTTLPARSDGYADPHTNPPDTAWVALSLIRHLGGKTFATLLAHFDHDPARILNATTDELREVRGIGAKLANAISMVNTQAVQTNITRWQKLGLHILTAHNPAYPSRFGTVDDAPPTIFAFGDLKTFNAPRAVAVVGTRKPDRNTRDIISNLVQVLVQRDITIISGLALGVDITAHQETLAYPQGKTVAVLGSGILQIYPREHLQYARAIARRGALLCEVAPDASVSNSGLVARNRLITGLSDTVFVMETRVDGGAMHAARFAQGQKRPVVALDIDASGNRQLIDAGAFPLATDLSNLGEVLDDN